MSNLGTLISSWIKYIKENHIAETNDANDGHLLYRRPVTVGDLKGFLTRFYQEDIIDNAIGAVLNSQEEPKQDASGGSKLSQTPNAIRKREQRRIASDQDKTAAKSFSNMAGQLQKKGQKPHYKLDTSVGRPSYVYQGLREDIDNAVTLKENQIKEIFEKLSAIEPQADKKDPEDDIRRLKQAIRYKMTPAQRGQLWRLLGSELTETEITKGDVDAVIKNASNIRKGKISIGDLQKAWIKAGRPDDTRDLARILQNEFGYSNRVIRKIFNQTFGYDRETRMHKVPATSKAVHGFAEYIKKHGYTDQIKELLSTEFPEDIRQQSIGSRLKNAFTRKATFEDISKIFNTIILEERELVQELINEQDTMNLGRRKKQDTESLTELVSLQDILKSSSYVSLLNRLKNYNSGIDTRHIKNQIIHSWRSGMRSRKHFNGLLNQINLNIKDLINE